MFSIEISEFFALYIGLFLTSLLVLWILKTLRLKRRPISQENICMCKSCTYSFVARRHETLVRCPRCNDIYKLFMKKY